MELVSHVRRMSPIFPRVSTFSGVALFQPAPRQKRERSFFASQTERNSIIDFSPTNSPLPPLSIHPKPLDIYRSAKVLLGFLRPNWQFRLSGISGAPFYSTPEFRLSSSFRAAPLFKVGNTLPTFLLKSPPSHLSAVWRGRKPHRIRLAIRHRAAFCSLVT